MHKISCILQLIACIVSFPAMAQWQITGNSGTTPGTNFIGTTTNNGLMFKTNAIQSGYIDLVNINTSFGQNTLISNTSGNYNNAFGSGALNANTTGTNNLAIGTWALVNSTTSSYNVAIGRQSQPSLTTGGFNTSTGYQALFSINTGSNNCVYGFQTMYANTSGTNNTAVGYNAGYDNTTGGDNTFIGYNAGRGITTGNNNTIIGANLSGLSASLSNNIIIADGSGNQRISTYLWGYNRAYPVASITNAAAKDVYYNSFEEGTGNSADGDSKTGRKSITTGLSAALSNLTNGAYLLTYWQKSAGVWSLQSQNVTVSSGTYTISLTGQLDEVRFYPAGARLTTYTFDPLIV